MSKSSCAALCGFLCTAIALPVAAAATRDGACVDSPRAVLSVCVSADARGPYYEVYRGEAKVIARSRLGLALDGFGNAPATQVSNARRSVIDTSWEQPWGEQRI